MNSKPATDAAPCPTCLGTGTAAPTEPDKFFFITQLREAVGLSVGAMPITPQQAWEEAIAKVRARRWSSR